ncbi:MAG: nucleotidyltransferase domain-containing protein [Thermodesulfovibrionales bacterium]|nr:nucleotidyltransferase domain-containing protein [Thermodesulfovibrionales bacterium]
MIDTEKLIDILKDYPYIASAYLFGSVATGKTGPLSDIDIAVLIKKEAPQGRELLHELDYIAYKIEKIFKKPVDIIPMNNKGLIFQHNILKTGRLIYDNDPSFRIKYVSNLISAYCDFEPLLRFMRRFHFEGYRKRLKNL